MSFERRITTSCNSYLASVNFSCAIQDHFFNTFGITHILNLSAKIILKKEMRQFTKYLHKSLENIQSEDK